MERARDLALETGHVTDFAATTFGRYVESVSPEALARAARPVARHMAGHPATTRQRGAFALSTTQLLVS